MNIDHKELIKNQINTMLAKGNLNPADLRDVQEKLRILEHLVREEANSAVTVAQPKPNQQP